MRDLREHEFSKATLAFQNLISQTKRVRETLTDLTAQIDPDDEPIILLKIASLVEKQTQELRRLGVEMVETYGEMKALGELLCR